MMEIAQLVVSPAVLLAAFIFFWREANAGRKEAKAGRLELETRLVSRMDRMEDRLESRFARLEDRLDARIDQLELKLAKNAEAG